MNRREPDRNPAAQGLTRQNQQQRQRRHSMLDRFIKHADNALRTIAGTHG